MAKTSRFDAAADGVPPQKKLLALLAEAVEPTHLHMIAHGDYGRDVEAHTTALQSLQRTLEVPPHFDWVPVEVMELFAWSVNIERPPRDPFPAEAQNITRAFCCTALLLQTDPQNDYDERLFTLSEGLAQMPLNFRLHLMPLLDWMDAAEVPAVHPAYNSVIRLITQLDLDQIAAASATLDRVLELEGEMLTQSADRLDCARFGGVRSFIGTPHWQGVGARLIESAPKVKDPMKQGLIEIIGRSLQAIPPQA